MSTGMRQAAVGAAERRRPGAGLVVGTFLYVWLMVGFFTGTVVLVGPVKWITAAVHAGGGSQGFENGLLQAVILAYVVASLFVTRWLVGRIWRSRSAGARLGIPAVATLLAGACLWAWSDPGRMLASVGGTSIRNVSSVSGAEFHFGAYPDREALKRLKEQGVTEVISLQSPAVLPFEPRSIAEERKNAAELGIPFVNVPMIPWVSDNAAATAKLRQIARTGKGRFYVHCGLGRDRTNVAMRIIQGAGAEVHASRSLHHASTFAERRTPFAHGSVYRLDDGVWLIPRPNDAELAGYLLAGQVKEVVSIMDPADTAQRSWIQALRTRMAGVGVAVREMPLKAGQDAKAAYVVRQVRALPHPVAVVAPHTQWDRPFPGTEPADLFRATYARISGVAPSPNMGVAVPTTSPGAPVVPASPAAPRR
ncbi:MAG: hypothetical protein JWM27_3662 [Gemmatimonadetes bacterium]|nr:hypothetical protein [Gemmatimonadota bacterium]